jgi:hypothetical protein
MMFLVLVPIAVVQRPAVQCHLQTILVPLSDARGEETHPDVVTLSLAMLAVHIQAVDISPRAVLCSEAVASPCSLSAW